MTENKDLVLGIDIGGSHITAGLINLQTKTVFDNLIIRKRVDCHAAANEILASWCEVINEIWKKSGINTTPVGIAMPGPFDYENGICLIKGFGKYESLYGLNIRTALAERMPIDRDKIYFRNDAEAFLDGELFCGAAKGYTHAIGITLGTGLGSAFSHQGDTADAELSVIEYKDEKIEESVSTRGVVRTYERLTGKRLKDGKAIADLYNTDEAAVQTFKILSEDLAWFLQYFIKRELPEVVVIGGNISRSWHLFIGDVMKGLSTFLPQMPVIVKAELGESAALIGAACYLNQQRTKKNLQDTAIQHHN